MFDLDDLANLNLMQKRVLIARANAFEEIQHKENEILKSVELKGSGHSVVGIINDIAILKYEYGMSSCVGMYTYKIFKDDKWVGLSYYFHTPEQAFLKALGEKYVGLNNDFEFYVGRMLGIEE